jgi:uncharacterized protein YabN with tetrapyrrole methylase and pyrophosphatase domain
LSFQEESILTDHRPPALERALQVSQDAVSIGFEWENIEQVWDKVHEEIGELKEVIASGQRDKQEEELGDLLFSVVNIGRWLGIDSEAALHRMLQKFQRRFAQTQTLALEDGRRLEDCSLEEMEEYWQTAKRFEREKKDIS